MSSNPNLPDSYNPRPPSPPTFVAPAHHLSGPQREQVIEVAESAHNDRSGFSTGSGSGMGSSNTGYTAGQTGYGSGVTGSGSGHGLTGSSHHHDGSSTRDAARDVIGGGTGSVTQSHTGQPGNYELGQGDLTGNRTSLTGGSSGIPSSGHHSGQHSGHGLSNHQGAGAAGLGGAGLAATAGAQGLGSGHHSSADNYGPSSSSSSSNNYSNTNTNQGVTSGQSHGTGHSHGTGQQEASRLSTTANSGSGPTAPSGTVENKLQSELERNALKKGTHAAGFGTGGMSSDSGKLNSEQTGISQRGATGGHAGQGGVSSSSQGHNYGQQSGMTSAIPISGNHPSTSTGGPVHGSNQGMQQQQYQGQGQGQHHLGGGHGTQGSAYTKPNDLVGEVETRAAQSGSNDVTGLGSAGVRSSHEQNTTGRAL